MSETRDLTMRKLIEEIWRSYNRGDNMEDTLKLLADFSLSERRVQMEEDCAALCVMCKDKIPLHERYPFEHVVGIGCSTQCRAAAIRAQAEKG